jgi:ubiquinone/menaquinone biosynthesis C-methylase UbiE
VTRQPPIGAVLHRAAGYDLLVWLFTPGRDAAFRDAVLKLAQLRPGEAVLDVGCGTGSLAIAAKQQLGTTSTVCAIDASDQMIERARKKARNAGLDITITQGVAQTLRFDDSRFDLVLSTRMLHHLPRKGRLECAREMRRVLRPGGRALVVDFVQPQYRRGVLQHFHRHGHVNLEELTTVVSEAGLVTRESGPLGVWNLHYVLALAPG